ncbi:MAG: flagellar protein [Lachnospiraceae bacterium]|nr:flagellar protein [Lachnospiraceae bacterium]
MNVKNCRKCGKIFNYIGGQQICPSCIEKLENKFQEVKEYILDHKDASSIAIVAEACDVDPNQIKQWVREERLTFGEGSALGIECESCGTPIKTGRFCEKCKNDMTRGLIDAAGLNKKPEPVQKPDRRDSARMRFLDR